MSKNQDKLQKELAKIEQAIAAQEDLRGVLPDEQIDTVVAALRARQKTLQVKGEGSGVVAQEGSVAMEGSVGVGGDVEGSVISGERIVGRDVGGRCGHERPTYHSRRRIQR